MVTNPHLCYSIGHQTMWNRWTARKSVTTGDRSFARGKDISLCCLSRCFVSELCRSLAPSLPQAWAESSSTKTHPRTASSLRQGTDTATRRDSLARTRGPWVLHRTLDLAKDRAVDREGVRCALSHR